MEVQSSRLFHRLKNYFVFVTFYNVLVILWGAYVRATGSGAGCGRHWPLCNGEIIPVQPGLHTQIEFFHRASSGLSLPLVLMGAYWIFKKFPKGSPIRKPAGVACISILVEALIGAGLVLFELVSHDQSLKRTISISLHFVNTLVLLGSLVLTATSLERKGKGWAWKSPVFKRQALFFISLFFAVGVAGAVTALGDTLFPAQSLTQGFQQDWKATSHFLVKLRVIHPILASFFVFLAVPWILGKASNHLASSFRSWGHLLIALLVMNLGIGLWNLAWLVPIGLQISHLSLALSIWIVLVIFLDRAVAQR